ncbi:MAG: hypothetical protein GX362_02415 [Methanosarcinaceae archaeon]|nr:hypothetical protein [Methanosarcinaceae archaeon]
MNDEVTKLVEEMNSIKKIHEIYIYIEDAFLMHKDLDVDDGLYNKLTDMEDYIEANYGLISEEESDNIKLKMRDLINEAYENGTLNFIKESKED